MGHFNSILFWYSVVNAFLWGSVSRGPQVQRGHEGDRSTLVPGQLEQEGSMEVLGLGRVSENVILPLAWHIPPHTVGKTRGKAFQTEAGTWLQQPLLLSVCSKEPKSPCRLQHLCPSHVTLAVSIWKASFMNCLHTCCPVSASWRSQNKTGYQCPRAETWSPAITEVLIQCHDLQSSRSLAGKQVSEQPSLCEPPAPSQLHRCILEGRRQ